MVVINGVYYTFPETITIDDIEYHFHAKRNQTLIYKHALSKDVALLAFIQLQNIKTGDTFMYTDTTIHDQYNIITTTTSVPYYKTITLGESDLKVLVYGPKIFTKEHALIIHPRYAKNIAEFFKEWKIREPSGGVFHDFAEFIGVENRSGKEIVPTQVIIVEKGNKSFILILKTHDVIIPYPTETGYYLVEIPYNELHLLDNDDEMKKRASAVLHDFNVMDKVLKIEAVTTGNGEYMYVFKNGAFAFINYKEIEYFSDPISTKTLQRLANAPFIVLDKLLRSKTKKITDFHVKKHIEDPVEVVFKIIRNKKRKINGPLLKVIDGDLTSARTIVTPRGSITIHQDVFIYKRNVVIDDYVLDAIRYVLGNDVKTEMPGKYVSVTLGCKYSTVKQTEAPDIKMFFLEGEVFWNCLTTKKTIVNEKYTFTATNTDFRRNVIPLQIPIKREIIEKIKKGLNVEPWEIFPGMDIHKTKKKIKNIHIKKHNAKTYRINVQYEDGSYKSFTTHVDFLPDYILYKKVLFIDGRANLRIPWTHNDGEVLEMTMPNNDEVEVEVHYYWPISIHETEVVHCLETSSSYDYTVFVIDKDRVQAVKKNPRKRKRAAKITISVLPDKIFIKTRKNKGIFTETFPIKSTKDIEALFVYT